jgi:hypothetical protein
LFFTWRSGSWIIRHTRQREDLVWARDLASMVQVSLVGYMSAGAFLGLQYFDLYYHLVAIIVITRALVQQRFAEEEKNGIAVHNADASHAKHSQSGRVGTPRRGAAVLGGNR